VASFPSKQTEAEQTATAKKAQQEADEADQQVTDPEERQRIIPSRPCAD
jgi:hypothetical protein